MALYGKDPIPDNLADLFGDQDFGLFGSSSSGSSRLPYSTSISRGVSSAATGSKSWAPQQNALERGARSLPRPKRRRKKRKPEVSLYPSLSAIEDCIPDTAALDFGASTSADAKSSSSSVSDSSSCCSSISDSSSCSSSQASSCTSGSTSLLRHPSKTHSRKGHDDDDPLDSLMAPSRASTKAPQAPSRHYPSKSSSLSIASFRSTNHSVGSSSSGGSRELERDFKRISLTSNKRRPMSRGGSVDSQEAKVVPEAPTISNTKAKDGLYVSRGDWRSSSGSSQDSEKTSKYYPSKDEVLYKKKSDCSSQSSSEKSYKSYPPYTPSEGISGTGSDEKTYYKSYSKSGNKGPSTFGSLIRSVHDDYQDDAQEQPLPREEPTTPAGAEKRAQHLEIEPGLLLPLRGAEETVKSIKAGFVESVYCQACDNELLCIADATFCVCPDCKCVSSVSGAVSSLAETTEAHKLYPGGSVGLGFRRNHCLAVS